MGQGIPDLVVLGFNRDWRMESTRSLHQPIEWELVKDSASEVPEEAIVDLPATTPLRSFGVIRAGVHD